MNEQLTRPKTQLQEVLYALLTRISITRRSLPDVLNLTARIADLRVRHAIDVRCREEKHKNKYGHQMHFGYWFLAADARDTAQTVYQQLTENGK